MCGSMFAAYVVFLLLIVTFTNGAEPSVIPQPSNNRILDMPPAGEERKEYDREAFLGKDEIQQFEQLTPEQTKEKLSIIYKKIDKDSNGHLTEEELRGWIVYVQNRYIRKNVDSQWSNYKGHENGSITWESYRERTYGMLSDDDEAEEPDNRGYNYRDMMKKDNRRWKKADQDDNGALTIEEFTDFLHPEESKHMRDIIVDETIEDIDKNRDGLISLEEYINDLWTNAGQGDGDDEAPEWVKTEREQFGTYRDKNKDGFMDWNEVRDWILPQDYDHTRAEAKHLIFTSDTDKDGMLTETEVLDHHDVFVGSQATDFGEALRKHDEF